jgi:hypothetical protein
MTRPLPDWIKLPSGWIENEGLKDFRWARGEGANNVAALMVLTVISHHVEGRTGVARLTYDDLCDMTLLSRAKVAAGLSVLATRCLIDQEPDGRSSFRLAGYNPERGWAMFPAKGLYRLGRVDAFANFTLRAAAELDAMKLYFLFASRRDRKTNLIWLGYEKIEKYSGIARNNIKRALHTLGNASLIYVEHVRTRSNDSGVASAYRLAHLETRRHMGTSGRGMDPADLAAISR